MPPKICLLALIGLPGAGKSSLSNWLLSKQQDALHECQIVHLCYDDYINTELAYREQRIILIQILEKLIAYIQGAADWPPEVRRPTNNSRSCDYLILCDDNFYYRSMRYKLYQLCRTYGCIYSQIYIATPLASCLQANSTRGADCLPELVLRKMNDRLEPPGLEAWECSSLRLQNSDTESVSQLILTFILSLFHLPTALTPLVPSPTQTQMQSPAHCLDLALRASIKVQLQTLVDAKAKKLTSMKLNEKRKEILVQFRAKMSDKQTDQDSVDLNYYVNLMK
ncbi:L-seryl-tRNA(Sec) kinase [Drosophila pseudoobscura]|uniref:L-seryl-tRNA(Sec) kinase n=1 Tax=Drosophila pseudoobscura pseudoobscura TaxID=46245 RepID=A0A6I8UZL5_DROPS|nr:L-seryl-tRNA(Sec) kinase [Drosophila pseudoobscura]